MIRTNYKNITAIITADWHLRETKPTCRTDDFWTAQWDKVHQVSALQKKLGCFVIHAGDLFNHWKPSPLLLTKTLISLPQRFYTIFGNHDLPNHNLELNHKCGTTTLLAAKRAFLLEGTHWDQPRKDTSFYLNNIPILVWHVMTWLRKRPWPGCTDAPANRLIKKMKKYQLIVTGHNHETFHHKEGGRLIVNPGCLTRQKVSEAAFKPCVFLWQSSTNTLIQHFLKVRKNVISNEHIQRDKEDTQRMEAFITRLDADWDLDISYEENMKRFLAANDSVRKAVKSIIWRAIDE